MRVYADIYLCRRDGEKGQAENGAVNGPKWANYREEKVECVCECLARVGFPRG